MRHTIDARMRALFFAAVAAGSAVGCGRPSSSPPADPSAAGTAPAATHAAAAPASGSTALAPIAAPAPSTPLPAHDVSFGGVHVRVPDALATGADTALVPARPAGLDYAPDGVHIVLTGYPLAGRTEPAELWVFHSPLDGSPPPNVMAYFMPIYTVIRDQKHDPGVIPTMPRLEPRRPLQARLQYLGIGGGIGRGARFLTMTGDTPRPVNNAELLYVVQGLIVEKGVFWSFRAPVTVNDPAVSADANGRPEGYEPFRPYLASTIDRLKALPADAFTPSLDLLDATVKSLGVDWPAPSQEQVQQRIDSNAGVPTPVATAAP